MPMHPMDVMWMSKEPNEISEVGLVNSNDHFTVGSPTSSPIIELHTLTPSKPIEMKPRVRRLSFTEMIFGSPSGGFSWGQSNIQLQAVADDDGEKKHTVSDDDRIKELMKRENKLLGDGLSSASSFSF